MNVDDLKDAAKSQTLKVSTIGDFIKDQREQAQVSLRQLAKLAGVSNPYLSQIERGLRKPSADILQQIAKGLRISAEQLYIQAGILSERAGSDEVITTILADTGLTERQKQVLVEIYESFRRENAATGDAKPADAKPADAKPADATPADAKPGARSAANGRPTVRPGSKGKTRAQDGRPDLTIATKPPAAAP